MESAEIREEVLRVQLLNQVRAQISDRLGKSFLTNEFPSSVEMILEKKAETLQIDYSFDDQLQAEAAKLLRTYKPDYGAIVLMNADTGQVLAMQSFEKNKPSTPNNWALRGTFPAASVFKIVTATAAIDQYSVSPDTLVMFNGSNHTLYKRNVLSNTMNRWTREMSLKEAFGRSVNTFFGRLAIEKLDPKDIEDYAIRFGFNSHVGSDLPFDTGFTAVPTEKNFQLAEIVSGYNRITRMSPIQGAMIAASVATGGAMHVPYVVNSLKNLDGESRFHASPVVAAHTMSPEGAEKLKVLMEHTVSQGTSRSAFRPFLRNRKLREVEVGGKTGSLSGDNPKGKTDWFVGYAITESERLAVAAVTVHVNKWTVKSAHLAQSLFQKHFKEKIAKEKLATVSLNQPK